MEINIPHPIAALFTCINIITISLIITRRKSKRVQNLPPGPWRLPLIGNLHQLICALPHHRLRDMARKYGPLMYLQLGEVPHIVVSSPEMAKEIMRTHDMNFAQRPRMLIAGKFYGLDLLFSAGDYWRMMKKISVEEVLSHKRVQSFRWIREEEMSNLDEDVRLGSGVPINLTEKIFSTMYVITSRVAFGGKCKDQDLFITNINDALKVAGGFSVCDVFPSLTWLHWIGDVRPEIEKMIDSLDRFFDGKIAEHKADRALGNGRSSGSLIDIFLTLQEKANLPFPLKNESIKAVILDLFVAGSETAATVTEWAMLEIMKNPRIMDKAQAEVRRVFGKQGNVDETALHELKFLKMIVKETLRLHPPGPFIVPRESKESCVINGYHIPAKTRVLISGWAIGRDPRNWDDPETFYPERFADSSIDFRGTNFEFIPFGSGRRMCPGIDFAIVDIELVLVHLLFHFDWNFTDWVNHENLDMNECFGLTVRRKEDLFLIPITREPKPVE